jgi:TPR repeat protein
MEWYAKAAEKGHVEAQMGLGEIYYSSLGLPKRDYATAYRWYAIAAGLGSKEAKTFTLRMQQTVLKEPHVTAEQKAASEKAAADWLVTYAKK